MITQHFLSMVIGLEGDKPKKHELALQNSMVFSLWRFILLKPGSDHLMELWLSLFVAGELNQMAFKGLFQLRQFCNYFCSGNDLGGENMTVEFDKETEGFVLNKLDSLTRITTRSDTETSISEVVAFIMTT